MDAPTTQAISALSPTPMNPDTAGWIESCRNSRQARITAATPSAALMAGTSPKAVLTGTSTATGSAE